MFEIPLGRSREPSPATESVRTPDQARAVRRIVESPDFDYACGNPLFEQWPGEAYAIPFYFLYYTKDGNLNAARVAPDGAVAYTRGGA